MNQPESSPRARIYLVVSADYDYDDENHYRNEGYHVRHAYESEKEAEAYAREQDIYWLQRDDSLERWTDEGDPESLYDHDPTRLEEVRVALGLEELTAEGLMWLEFAPRRRLTEEQARILIDMLGIGDYSVMSIDLYLRPGEAVEEAETASEEAA